MNHWTECPRQGADPEVLDDDFEWRSDGEVDSERVFEWEEAISWLERGPPARNLEPLPRGLRLIDVEKKKVVRAQPSTFLKYACLSYVWGNVTRYQATSENIHELERDGSLAQKDVPKTIQDAILACKFLGIEYLWVDRLCILQDDDEPDGEKQTQINDMGRIYSHAIVTLAATEGDDADFGLCGVSKRLSPLYLPPKFKIARLSGSRWAKRGWTYQEAILSRLLIVFSGNSIYPKYDKIGARSEEEGHDPFLGAAYTLACLEERESLSHDYTDYVAVIKDYTRRELSDQNDIMNAFHGICCHLFGNNNRFGIPLDWFLDAVMWLPHGFERERRVPQGRHVFPSWSWTSVNGPISISSRALPYTIHVASWIFVDQIDTDGKAFTVIPRPQGKSMSNMRDPDADTYPVDKLRVGERVIKSLSLACRYSLMPTIPIKWETQGLEPWIERRRERDSWFPDTQILHKEFWEDCQGFDQSGQPSYLADIPQAQQRLATQPGRVLVFSQSASLAFLAPERCRQISRKACNNGDSSSCPLAPKDAKSAKWDQGYPLISTYLGFMGITDHTDRLHSRRCNESYGGQASCGLFVGCGMVGFVTFDDKNYKRELLKTKDTLQLVALSIDSHGWFGHDIFKLPSLNLEILSHFTLFSGSKQDLLCVMAVETLPNGLSRRIGLGFVECEKWFKLEPKKSSFVLE